MMVSKDLEGMCYLYFWKKKSLSTTLGESDILTMQEDN